MKLEDLKSAGAFVKDAPVKKSITWRNLEGKTHKFDVLVKRRSYGQIEETLTTEGKARGAITIAESVMGDDGAAVFTYEEAYNLEPTLASKLLKVIGEVNAVDQKEAAKN